MYVGCVDMLCVYVCSERWRESGSASALYWGGKRGDACSAQRAVRCWAYFEFSTLPTAPCSTHTVYDVSCPFLCGTHCTHTHTPCVTPPCSRPQPPAANAFIAWTCCVLNNPRIANPDIQENLLAVVGLLLDNARWRGLLEGPQQHDKAVALIGGLLRVFDSRLWHPTTGVLLK